MGTLLATNPKTLNIILARRFEGETDPKTGEIIKFLVSFDRGYEDASGKFVQVGPSEGMYVPKEKLDALILPSTQKALTAAFDQYISGELNKP
ncbi:MAG: hypothetical protein QMD05_09270 [Candidatus Brocadiaceae bacterium]|nr:hypothetical protein [Candidatus Brocadiaceae bacterium]